MSRFFRNKTDPNEPVITSTDDLQTIPNLVYIDIEAVKNWAWKHFGLEKDSSLWKELNKEE